MMRWTVHLLVGVALLTTSGLAQTATALRAAIEQLGDFDYGVRLDASRSLRRGDVAVVVPLLLDAMREHQDSYVQFRAAVLFYGFESAAGPAVFEEALDSPNDRVRAAAYEYFEQVPSLDVVPKLLDALDTETSEFVRPYLVRALAANDEDPAVQRRLVEDIHRGQEYFRGAAIEALGDHGASYAVDALIEIISDDGPLRDDALLALGKIGDRRALLHSARCRGLPIRSFNPSCLRPRVCSKSIVRDSFSTSLARSAMLLRPAMGTVRDRSEVPRRRSALSR